MSKNICIIGPVPPFMGGIPQYNELLARELVKAAEVTLISYKRQYPKFLVRNREQINKEYMPQDDFLSNVHWIIDSINPITWIKTLRFIKKRKIELIILPWWVIFWSPMYVIFCLYFKIKGIKTLMICHNVFEHDDNFFKQLISKLTLKLADYFVVHSESEKNKLRPIVGKKPIIKHLIPLFNIVRHGATKEIKRNNASLKMLFFGSIREYKGLDLLLESLALLNNNAIELVIVGDFWKGTDHYEKIIYNKSIPNVSIVNHYIPDEMIQQYFDQCDVVVLPYKSATGSAVIPLAYSYTKPVLVTNVGGLPEAVEHKKTGYIVEANPQQIAIGIKWFIEHNTHDFTKAISNFIETSMSWSGLVACINELD